MIIVLIIGVSSVKAADVYSVSSPKEICDAVASDKVSIYMTTLTSTGHSTS